MRKLLLGATLLAALFAGCSSGVKEGFRLKGKIAGLQAGSKVYLDQLTISSSTTIDTASVNEDGTFEMTGNIKEEALFSLRLPDEKAMLMVMDEKPSDIYLEADSKEQFIKPTTIKGSRQSSVLYAFYKTVDDRGKEIQDMQNSLQAEGVSDSIKQSVYIQMKAKEKAAFDYIQHFCDTVQGPVLPILISTSFLRGNNSALNLISENTLKKYPSNALARDFSRQLKGSNTDPRNPKQHFENGQVLPDIVLTGIDGTEKKLSSLRGQYVLVDFWASWCGPCRKENPIVVEAYNQYKNKGFNIYSVSLDEDKNKWQLAIQQDKLAWSSHVSDLQGWQSPVAKSFGIISIPANYLIDKEGKVIAYNLRGEDLAKKLDEIF